jgi:hypothetical protein
MDVTFTQPLSLKGVESAVPAGTYRIDIEEELIDGLSFLAYRRLATFINIPMSSNAAVQDFLIDPKDPAAAQERDQAADAPTDHVKGAAVAPPIGP